MAKQLGKLLSGVGGIADSPKFGIPNSFAWASGLEVRSNPTQFTVNPRTVQEAAGIVTDLPMWGELACNTDLYFYGNTGNMYHKTPAGAWSMENRAAESSGNGLCYFPEDGYLYYTQDKTIGRKSEPCGSGLYYDGFLESEGGEPTNTRSIVFAKASSQYASVADNASLSITGDISLETYINPTSLPATNEIQTLISKWNENSQRSYKLDITTSSNAFGDGRDGALTISTNTTEDPVDANCTGTIDTNTLTITNAHASFSAVTSGDRVLIHQSRGANTGVFQIATVQGYNAGVLTLQESLTFSPAHSATAGDANKAQVRLLKQHTDVTVNVGITYTAKAWNGLKGGILGWYANGTQTISGTVTATGCGFRGGAATVVNQNAFGYSGEGYIGQSTIQSSWVANGNGAGSPKLGSDVNHGIGGSGGGSAFSGARGGNYGGAQADPGNAFGSQSLVTLSFGGGGSSGAKNQSGTWYGLAGGAGGGIICNFSKTITVSGSITSGGNTGQSTSGWHAAGGGGAGGNMLIKCYEITMGTNLITSPAGAGGTTSAAYQQGGAGSVGIIALYYYSTYTGSTLPAATIAQDSTLNTNDGYVLRFLVSSNGSNSEIYSTDITSMLAIDRATRWQVTWASSTSTANFSANGVLLKTQVGTLTSIYNSTARFAVAADYDSSSAAQHFGDYKMDDTRVWNDVRTQSELVFYNDRVLTGVESNLCFYGEFENNVDDSQTYTATSDLTATNTPTYSSIVPFSGITDRVDQDYTVISTGSTYTLGTAISEGANDRRTFQPTKEPIKSVQLKVDTVGTGNWTVVVHDGLNREMASVTVANANMHTGYYEFVFASSFRPILTANYHVHVYSSVGDGKIVTSTLNKMEGDTITSLLTGADFATFFQILVDDEYHPITQFLNFLVVGNERYVATLEAGSLYTPHKITLPAGYRVRCFAIWNEYLAIGTWKGTSITDTDQGKIFLWDGSSDTSGNATANYIIDVLEGGVNAMKGGAGILSIIAGYEGKLLQYGGGQTQKVTQLPYRKPTEYAEVAPGAMTLWRSLLRVGGTLNTSSSTIHQGVYSYGKLNLNYDNALTFDYPLSLGDQTSSSVKVGSLFPKGDTLYIGWQNGNAFGIDSVDVANAPYAKSTIELLISDLGSITNLKWPLVYRVDFNPLIDGQSVSLKYKANRQDSWRALKTQDTEGATDVRATISQQVREIQLAADITIDTSLTTESPEIISIALEADQINTPL